jgi:cytochrome P450
MFPEVSKALREELDTVVGDARLPTFDDRPNLPYTNAFAKELFRWHTITPLGFAHCLQAEDEFNGYRIPAGSYIIPNVEAMLHDPQTYRDPLTFDPTRFMPEISGRPAEQDPYTIGFGFGRRVCSGMKVADAMVFMACAMIGAVLDVQPAAVDGKPEKLVYEKTLGGVVSHPTPFNIDIRPRTIRVEELLG